jgi:diadenosine tetraphosphate (Ap4A) HIT family hydrolase
MLNHKSTRTKEQRELMARIEADGVCPFCEENFKTYHPRPILKETEHWFVTENMRPYEGTTTHLIFVYKDAHIHKLSEVKEGAALDLFALLGWVEKEYGLAGGSFFMRFGDMEWNGSSVEHLHAQLLVGVPQTEEVRPLRVKLGWRKNNSD